MGRAALAALLLAVLPYEPAHAQRSGAENREVLSPWLVSTGFASRRAEAKGLLHLARREIALESARTVIDVLRRVPGVRIRRLADGGSQILLDPTLDPDGGQCEVGVYLNGSAVDFGRFNLSGPGVRQPASRPVRVDDILPLHDIDGLELYAPDASPVMSQSTCGALLLWSAQLRRTVDEPLRGGVRGSVTGDADGAPVAGARVTLRPLDVTRTTDQTGVFVFDDVPPGRYDLTVEVAGAPPWSAELTVKAFAVFELDVRVGATGRSVGSF